MAVNHTPVLILDGGLGTTLQDAYGVHFDDTTPLWSSHLLISSPETLRLCQREFASVPVDILLTATYQVSIDGFRHAGVSVDRIPSFLHRAISIGEEVRPGNTKLALSLGPYGACMTPSQEYSGLYDHDHDSVDKLFSWHLSRIDLFAKVPLLASRVDFLAFETVPRRDEILAIRQLTKFLSSAASDSPLGMVPFWISCVFPNEDCALPDGTSIDQVIEALLSLEISENIPWGIGVNCTKIAKLPQLIALFEDSVKLLERRGHLRSWPSLLLYPDGTNGEIYDTATKRWGRPVGAVNCKSSSWEHQLADIVSQARDRCCWQSIVVGGCCKATPADISRLRKLIFDNQ
ncbi:Homocysteine S-methyltransferase [Xylariaceae sp. FL0255]|nr:Homocysteine S-methyltransferase [Xylariaceae sp. FL0255]